MKGKYITTSLKLAVLAASKRAKKEKAIRPNAVANFHVIWSKEFIAEQIKKIPADKLQTTVA